MVECNSVGIVWGIGYDHTAWVYTGGYGGGFFQGLASSTDNIYTQTDVKSVYIYENQRWNPVTGYTNRLKEVKNRCALRKQKNANIHIV